MSNNDELSQAVRIVANFLPHIASLQRAGESSSAVEPPQLHISFDLPDGNKITFIGAMARRYRSCLNALDEVGPARERLGKKGLEDILQATILASLNPDVKESIRVSEALKQLRNSLTIPPRLYRVYHQVTGVEKPNVPVAVGQATFAVFDATEIHRFEEVLDRPDKSALDLQLDRDLLERMVGEPLRDTTVAVVEILAVDIGSAKSIAFQKLRLVADTINYFINLAGINARISLVGELNSAIERAPVIIPGENPHFSISQRRIGAIQDIGLDWFMQRFGRSNGFDRVRQLLEVADQDSLAIVLITAIQWAGRAAVESRSEEAFLLYAIALESLILGGKNDGEIGYQLKIRVAHLLGSDVNSRLEIASDIANLYNIRSYIVHRGTYRVTDDDLGLLQYYVHLSITRLLIDQPFTEMTEYENLVKWFNDCILR